MVYPMPRRWLIELRRGLLCDLSNFFQLNFDLLGKIDYNLIYS
jgi:hypothetical protein